MRNKGRLGRILSGLYGFFRSSDYNKEGSRRFFSPERAVMPNHSPILKFNYQLPYGAILRTGGVQFSIVSRFATGMRLLLYKNVTDPDPAEVIAFDPLVHRWGDVWTLYLEGIEPGQLYHFQADGPFDPAAGDRFDSNARLIDPYAKALAGDFLPAQDGIVRPPKCVVVSDDFDWSGERHIRRPLIDSVIYETHVRGFTQNKNSGVKYPGTYLGLIEKIPYLQSLGVTTVELMPVHEFPTNQTDGTFSPTQNYWGYDPMAFFAPHRGYAHSKEPGAQVREFKQMVLALHRAGIEVILDVVFNHTAEGNENGPTLSFKGLNNRSYYLLGPDGSYRNYSGCGNTVNGNHPLLREMIFSCLRHWVQNYHIDGFRFDLASILSRDQSGQLVANPPVLENIAEDPMLAETKIIAEAWDAAGAYQVGSFGSRRWAEWNGRFRDDVRKFWRGAPYSAGPFATRLAGSSDLYAPSGRSAESSVNFITAHDGFTLNDLVSYEHKHNDANGEENRDGENNNISFNCGVEGPTADEKIDTLRERLIRNFFVSLLFSQGVPMILAGDEIRRTQNGNNNAWCQNNAVSWFDWKKAFSEKALLRFVRTLIDFRLDEPALRRRAFLTGQPSESGELADISWFSPQGGERVWNDNPQPCLAVLLSGQVHPSENDKRFVHEKGRFHIFTLLNGTEQSVEFLFPAVTARPDFLWRLFINTAADSPNDIYPDFDGPKPILASPIIMEPKSLRVYLARIPE